MKRYNPKEIEAKWRKVWADTKLYETPKNPGKNKYYCLVMYPYPSGNIHIGHWYNFGPGDSVARFNRMLGKKLLHPIGYDAFGLPAENAAIQNNIPPAKWTRDNVATMTKQLESIGTMYDWEKVVNTSTPEYYKWTQWIFLKLFEQDLAYKKKGIVNWCPKDKTVLANEQVVSEKNVCERCGTPVIQRELKQWYFKITDYAERLLNDSQDLDWPERVKTMQSNWIGKSVGAEVDFSVVGSKDIIKIFTTRPDTLFGATYMVLAPEHPLVDKLTTKENKNEIEKYEYLTAQKTELERKEGEKDKTGVFTGGFAVNPVNDKKIPVWIAEYVLMSYGTGAIMAVPAHDERDNDFAKKYNLPVINVINPKTGSPQKKPTKKGKIVALVVNPKGKVLTLNWGPKLGGRLLVGGTIDGDEESINTAKREIEEETGYTDLQLLIKSDEQIHHEYYSYSKKKEWQATTDLFHFKLNSDDQVDQKLEKNESFSVEWVDQDVARSELKDPLHKRVFDKFIDNIVYTGEGVLGNSGKYDGTETYLAREKIVEELQKIKKSRGKTNYKLRDWLISRQRYWGAPIPVVTCDECGIVPIPYEDLPVVLPEDVEFEPTGQSPLLKDKDFINTRCPECDGNAKRETDTMDTFVDSSWYFLRYPNTNYDKGPFDPAAIEKWGNVDHYIGGIEHAILHLLYARFITKVLHDHGDLPYDEPFKKLTNQGIILGPDGHKMSKSRGNVVDPDEQVSSYGSDSLRLYLMFMGPYDQGGPYDLSGITGTRRFIDRVWQIVMAVAGSKEHKVIDPLASTELAIASSKTIKKVTHDINELHFNTAISKLMEFVNTVNKIKDEYGINGSQTWRETASNLVLLLAPLTPHVAEELWQELGNDNSVHSEAWPTWDESLIKNSLITIVIQINGKVRANIEISADVSEDDMVAEAKKHGAISTYLDKGELINTIIIPGKLVNFVIK